jgi:hypothetical protein
MTDKADGTDGLEAAKGDWGSDFNVDANGGNKTQNSKFPKAEFISFAKQGNYKIRLVGSFVKFRRHWKPYKAITHDSLRDVDPAWKAGFYPKRRFAINVIDRSDGKLKIMEQGPTVFKAFSDYKEASGGIDPAGKDGPDFTITVKIPMKDGKPDTMHKQYGVVAGNQTALTGDEKKMLCKVDENGNVIKGEDGKPITNLWDLKKIFKPTSAEKMADMWANLSDSAKKPPKRKDADEDDESESAEPKGETKIAEPVSNNAEDVFASDASGKDSSDLF